MKKTWWIGGGIIILLVLVAAYAYTQMSPVSSTTTVLPTATTTTQTNPIPTIVPSGDTKPPVPVPTPDQTGTLSGTVTLSPTCPVETNPPSPNCAPKPYVTQVTITRTGTTIMQLTTAQTNSQGNFEITLAPGTYSVSAGSGNSYPRCSSVNTQITKGSKTTITLSCDTGIR